MKRVEFEIEHAKGRLAGQYYPVPDPIAVVILIHGLGEYGRRYERAVVPVLTDHGIAVLSYDQFGHGLSSGKKGHHPGYAYLLDSVDLMIDKAKQVFPGTFLFLYGHSMGGNIAINYSLRRPEKISGSIVTSPFLRLAFEPPSWKISLGRIMAGIFPSITLPNGLDVKAISRDPEEILAYEQDPLIHGRVSPAYSLTIMEEGDRAMKDAGNLKIPMLLFHGTADRVTDHKASEEFTQRTGNRIEFNPVKGGYHELHHDLEREKVLNRISSWVKEKSIE